MQKVKSLKSDKNRFSYEDDDANYSIIHLNGIYITAVQTPAALKSSERFKAIENSASSIDK